MKKLILALTLLVSISQLSFTAENNLYIRGSLSLDKLSNRDKESKESIPFELSLEATTDYFDHIEVGFGVSYLHRGKQGFNYKDVKVFANDASTTPIYLIAKYNVLTDSSLIPYLKSTLGYSYSSANFSAEKLKDKNFSIKNSAFVGLGLGVEYNYFNLDLMYRIDYTDFKMDTETLKANLNTLMLGVGYRF